MKKTYIAPAITELKMENNTIMAGSTGSTTPGASIKNLEEESDPFSAASSAKRSNLWDEE